MISCNFVEIFNLFGPAAAEQGCQKYRRLMTKNSTESLKTAFWRVLQI